MLRPYGINHTRVCNIPYRSIAIPLAHCTLPQLSYLCMQNGHHHVLVQPTLGAVHLDTQHSIGKKQLVVLCYTHTHGGGGVYTHTHRCVPGGGGGGRPLLEPPKKRMFAYHAYVYESTQLHFNFKSPVRNVSVVILQCTRPHDTHIV